MGLGPRGVAGETEELGGVYRLRSSGGNGYTAGVAASGTMKKKTRHSLDFILHKKLCDGSLIQR